MMPKLVVLTGPDGAGKSTVCDMLAKMLGPQAKAINVWDALRESPFYPCKSCVHEHLEKSDPLTRSLFILHFISQSLSALKESSYQYVIFEGYWYKYAISEFAMNGSGHLSQIGSTLLPVPDLTIFLDVHAEFAWQRKSDVSAYELGFLKTGSAKEQFCKFQKHIYQHWETWLQQHPSWQRIDTHQQSAGQIASDIHTMLMGTL